MVYKNSNGQSNLLGVQKEKRRELRVPLRVIRMRIEKNGEIFFGYAKNISAGGMFIPTLNPKPVNERFRLKFVLPGLRKQIVVTAEVVWTRSYSKSGGYEPGMGIKFVEISEEDAEIIREFVDSEKKER